MGKCPGSYSSRSERWIGHHRLAEGGYPEDPPGQCQGIRSSVALSPPLPERPEPVSSPTRFFLIFHPSRGTKTRFCLVSPGPDLFSANLNYVFGIACTEERLSPHSDSVPRSTACLESKVFRWRVVTEGVHSLGMRSASPTASIPGAS